MTPHTTNDSETLRQIAIKATVKAMTIRLTADTRAGLLPAESNPDIVVPVIVTYMQDLWRMALVSYDRLSFERQVDLFLTGMGL